MKTLLLGATAVLAVLSAAAVANAQDLTQGYVGASYSTINTGDSKSNTSNANVYAVRGVAGINLDKGVEAQVDLDGASVDTGVPSLGSVTVWGPTAHVFVDSKDGSKAGAFVGYEDIGTASVTAYGGEARFVANDMLTFGATAAWGSANTKGSSYNEQLRAYRGVISYFPSDDVRVDLSGDSYRTSSPNPGDKSSVTVFAIDGEFQPMGSPVAVTAGFEHPSSGGSTYDAFTVGVRKLFGGSLKDRDRKSAPFDDPATLFGGIGGFVYSAEQGATSHSSSCESSCSPG